MAPSAPDFSLSLALQIPTSDAFDQLKEEGKKAEQRARLKEEREGGREKEGKMKDRNNRKENATRRERTV